MKTKTRDLADRASNISVDNSAGCQLSLSKDSLEANTTTAKSSEINVFVPASGPDNDLVLNSAKEEEPDIAVFPAMDGIMLWHAYSSLINVDPLVFLYLAKECLVRGTCAYRTKLYALEQHFRQALHTKPKPAVFVAHCLYLLPIFEPHCEGLSHRMLNALNLFLMESRDRDFRESKFLAIQSFRILLSGTKFKDPKILLEIPAVYRIKERDLKEALLLSDEEGVEQFVSKLLEIQSYMTVVSLLEYFNIRHSKESFINEMLKKEELEAAEKWVSFIGKPHELINEYVKREMLKEAGNLVITFELREEFPELYRVTKERKIKHLADKGLWDLAEERADPNSQLLQFLVDMAMRAGETGIANTLCAKYPSSFLEAREAEATLPKIPYLLAQELSIEIIWVSEPDDLRKATTYIDSCTIIGMDVEWKPNYKKGENNKVSILQIASEKEVFIIDLIKLCRDHSDVINDCLIRVFRSRKVLKLGYDFRNDMKKLAESYGELHCFKHLERLLDLKKLYNNAGGLKGLTEEVLGFVLNKRAQMSNWEKRPLSSDQLDYAALDAAVLINIFRHAEQNKPNWESHIISYGGETSERRKVS